MRAEKTVGCIGVGGLDRLVLRCENAGHVVHLVPPTLVFRVGLVDEIGILDPVAVHHREAKSVGLLDDVPQFGWRGLGGYRLGLGGRSRIRGLVARRERQDQYGGCNQTR
jgi:hypothetical protein